MTNHRDASADLIHTPYRQIFANDAARIADSTRYNATDLYKKAFQVDSAAEYVLTSIGPTVWTGVGGGGGGSGVLYDPAVIDPTALYNFNGDGNDSSGNGYDLVASGAAEYINGAGVGVIPPADQRLAFKCDTTHWDGPAAEAALRITDALTLQAWILPAFPHAGVVLAHGQTLSGSIPDDNVLYLLQISGGDLLYGHETAAGVWISETAVNNDVPIGVWSHVAVTRNAAGTGIKIYLNSRLVWEATMAAKTGGGATGELEIAAFGSTSTFRGGMMGVMIEPHERSAAQIAVNYRQGVVGP